VGGKRDSHHSDWLSDALAAKHTCARKYVHTHIRTCAHSTHLVAPPPPLPNATLDLSTAIDSAEPPHTRTHTRRERERERALKKSFSFFTCLAAIDRPGPPKSLLASRATIRAAAAAAQLEHQKAQVEHANQGTESEGPGDEIRQSLPSQGAEKHAGLAADMRRDAKITLGVGGDPSVSGVRESSVYESEASNPHKWTISESFD